MYIYIISGTKGLYIGITRDKTSCKLAGNSLELMHWWNVSTRYLALKVEVLLQRYQRNYGDEFIFQLVNDIPLGVELLVKEALDLPDTFYQSQHKLEV